MEQILNEKRNFLREISNLAEQVKELPENEREEALLLINKAQVAIENIQDLSESIGSGYESICEKIFNDTSASIENRKMVEGYDQKNRRLNKLKFDKNSN